MTIDKIYELLSQGKKVYWVNKAYIVHIVDDPCPEKNMFSHRDGKMLRVTCESNYFGSRITEKCLGSVFIEE